MEAYIGILYYMSRKIKEVGMIYRILIVAILSYVLSMIHRSSFIYIIHNTGNKYMVFQGRIWKKVSHYSVLVPLQLQLSLKVL